MFRPPAVRERVPGRYGVRRTSAYINHVYFYLWDVAFGAAFVKLCTYAPWSIRVWLNGHSWAKRQLEGRHIGYQPLDNGFAAVTSGPALQEVCDSLSAAAIERFVRRWLAILPSPLSPADGAAGYRYGRLSGSPVLQRALPLTYRTDLGLVGLGDRAHRLRERWRTAGCGPARPVVWEGAE